MQPPFPNAFDVDDSQARINAAFYESYANTVLTETTKGREPGGFTTDAEDAQWALRMDAATSLREAGQWATLFDVQRARRLFASAGTLFLQDGHGFGSFLLAVSGSDSHLEDPQAEIATLLSLHELEHRSGSDNVVIPAAMHHPQQQAYLLLSLTARSKDLHEERSMEDLHRLCSESPHRYGNLPVGALGAPIRYFWTIAQSFLEEEPPRFADLYVEAFQSRYAEDMASAQVNDYLWRHGAAPVDVLDIDAIGVATLAAQRFGPRVVENVIDDSTVFMSPMLRAFLSTGNQLAMPGRDGQDR